MERRRKEESLGLKFLRELDSLLRVPNQVKTRGTNSSSPMASSRMATAMERLPISASSASATPPIQIGNGTRPQPLTSLGARPPGIYPRKTTNSVPVQAVNKSVQLKPIQPPPRSEAPMKSSSSRPFTSSASANQPQVRQQRARRTERLKSIKRNRPPPTRSSSLFYLAVGEEPSRGSNETEQRGRSQQPPPGQRSASVDDLLDIGNYGSSGTDPGALDSSLFFPSQNQIQLSPPQITNASSDLLIFSAIPDVPPPLSLNEPPTSSSLISERNSGVQRQGRSGAVETDAERSTVELLSDAFSRTVQVDDNQVRQIETPPPSAPSRASSSRTIPTRSYYSTVSLDSILNHDQVRHEMSRRLSTGTPTRLDANAGSQMSLPSSSVPYASTSSLMPKPSSSSVTGVDSLMSYDRTMDGLKVNEKVVWFTDRDVPQVGLIKWLGKINEKHIAGVEFDNHVGNTSGRWNGRKLFNASLTRGRFVPITELLLYSDYSQKLPFNAPAKIEYPSWEKAEASNEDTPTIICVICQDPLLTWETEEEEAAGTVAKLEKNMITTHCGHLFHHTCLTKWFNIKKKPIQPCPYCQRAMQIQDTIRIYPVQSK